MGRKTKLSEEQIQAICDGYQAGKSLGVLAKSYPLSASGIFFLLKRRGIETRKDNSSYRKHSVNEDFFNEIDTEEKAYWLGFISTDGHVRHKGVEIELTSSDFGHLEKFRSSIQSTHPISIRDRGRPSSQARIYIASRKMALSLCRLGLNSHKTFTLTPCKEVPPHLLRHYWRGAVDGDGHLSKKKKTESRRVSLCSASYSFLEGYKDFVLDHIPGFDGSIVEPKSNFFCVNCVGISFPRQLAHILYHNATVYLERKYKLAQEIMETQQNYVDLSAFDKETLEFLYEREEQSWVSVSKVIGIRPDSLFNLKKKVGILSRGREGPLEDMSRTQKIEAVIDALEGSKNNLEAAAKLGISYDSFYHLRKKLDIGLVRQIPKWLSKSSEEKRAIVLAALEKHPGDYKGAAHELGISEACLYSLRKQLDLPVRKNLF